MMHDAKSGDAVCSYDGKCPVNTTCKEKDLKQGDARVERISDEERMSLIASQAHIDAAQKTLDDAKIALSATQAQIEINHHVLFMPEQRNFPFCCYFGGPRGYETVEFHGDWLVMDYKDYAYPTPFVFTNASYASTMDNKQ